MRGVDAVTIDSCYFPFSLSSVYAIQFFLVPDSDAADADAPATSTTGVMLLPVEGCQCLKERERIRVSQFIDSDADAADGPTNPLFPSLLFLSSIFPFCLLFSPSLVHS